jgi:WD40 repeat protein
VPQGAVVVPDPSLQAFADEFDQLIQRDRLPLDATAAGDRFNEILARKVAALDRTYSLSQSQKQKLKLAGRGDIKRFEDRLDGERQKFVAARRGGSADAVRAASAGIGVLRATMESGPFGEESLFVKAQKTILSTEQLRTHERRRQLAAQSSKAITIENVRALETTGRFRKDVCRIAWNRKGDAVGLMEFDKPVQICSGDEFRPVRTIGVGRKLVGFDFSRERDEVAIAENSKNAFVINLSTGHETALETGNAQPSVTFSPDGKLLATGGYGTRAALWSAQSGKRIRELDTGEKEGGLTPVFSPDGRIIAVGNRNSSTRLFDVASGRVLRELRWQSSHELKFDPAGKRLAVAYVDGQLAVWSVESGNLLQRVTARAKELYSVDWSPDGEIIASSGLNAAVTLWNAATLTMLSELESPEWVICVRFNPKGTRLVFAGGSQASGGDRYVEILGVP